MTFISGQKKVHSAVLFLRFDRPFQSFKRVLFKDMKEEVEYQYSDVFVLCFRGIISHVWCRVGNKAPRQEFSCAIETQSLCDISARVNSLKSNNILQRNWQGNQLSLNNNRNSIETFQWTWYNNNQNKWVYFYIGKWERNSNIDLLNSLTTAQSNKTPTCKQ